MPATHDIVIKSDRRGRLRFTREQRSAMLEAYDASGLIGPKFSQLHGINYLTFDGTGTRLEAVNDRRGKIGRDRCPAGFWQA